MLRNRTRRLDYKIMR
ncbi:hypothetical protein QUG16_19650 [Escherichia coli]|nr:hypothetical protein [Escherichia coli]MDM6804903.1 hypothetical protein [Escherichia coli]MDM6826031.1 hypothetical protein [Escherichia coli]